MTRRVTRILFAILLALVALAPLSAQAAPSRLTKTDILGVHACAPAQYRVAYLLCTGSTPTFSLSTLIYEGTGKTNSWLSITGQNGAHFTGEFVTVLLYGYGQGFGWTPMGSTVIRVGAQYDVTSVRLLGVLNRCFGGTPTPGQNYMVAVVEANEDTGAMIVLGKTFFALAL
jgi:hypothetical protein